MSAIDIDWTDLAKVAGAAAVFGIGIVVVFALGVLGVSQVETARQAPVGTGRRGLGLALAAGCFAVCAAAVLYGLYLIIPQLGG